MPIYTFRCPGCKFQKEVICKLAERAEQRDMCPTADCSRFGDVLEWAGVEGQQSVRPDGAYEMKIIRESGEKVPVAHQRVRRRDY